MHKNRAAGSSLLSRARLAMAAGILLLAGLAAPAAAQSNIAVTRHNLSKSGSFTVKAPNTAAGETQVCAFCHTPHGATTTAPAPLWNRKTSAGTTYTRYTSASLDADVITDGFKAQPGGSSIMCLSCHDGTVALGNVNVLRGAQNVTISLTGTNPAGGVNPAGGANLVTGGMPVGSNGGAAGGFTRVIGSDLSNDHPISVTYNSALVNADKELRTVDVKQQHPVGSGTLIGVRSSGYKPLLPLQATSTNGQGQVQCATCHDPHITRPKFLRLNRMQAVAPTGGDFNSDNDIICLACHDKAGTEWSNSAHASSAVANESYKAAAATLREFPDGASTQVWQAACLNCHDTHTVAGARRLLREGTDSTSSPKQGGKSAIEETCYQCHAPNSATTIGTSTHAGSALTLGALSASEGVPDIWSEFQRAIRMPIKTAEQGTQTNTQEVHEITSADFDESPTSLGFGVSANRHAECTDCHNPHRVIRNARYDGAGASQRTHVAGGTADAKGADGNIASGVLRGIWGVEVDYGTVTTWPKAPTYTKVSGIPGKAPNPLTKEYQLCFKCHSDYSNASFPLLRASGKGGTPTGTNGMSVYTNVAAEFAANGDRTSPITGKDQGEYGESTASTNEDGTAIEPDQTTADPVTTNQSYMTDETGTQNHRSWHPVVMPTGRTRDERRMSASGGNFRTPFGAYVGTQTMHCSDCHGNNGNVEATSSATANSWTRDSGPNLARVQGPHGSSANFLLKGEWSSSVSLGGNGLCFNCHDPSAGSSGTGDSGARPSGFNNAGTNGGGGHGNEHGGRACMNCHVAVPHGWRNKAFLVNLNCVGAEGGQSGNCISVSTSPFDAEPYYYRATLRVKIWRPSGNWQEGACGRGSSTGKDWMTGACDT